MKKSIGLIFVLLILVLILGIIVLSHKPKNISQDIEWGVSFSKYSAEASGLNWREVYLAILDDLKPKSLRLPIYWREVEPETGEYYFDDYDWLVTQAEEREVKLILVIGSKAPRWPKRQLPDWAVELDEPIQQSKILDLNSKIIKRYRNLTNLYAWQVESEPLMASKGYPKLSNRFLSKEIKAAHSLDSEHLILVTDNGVKGFWLPVAGRGDILGVTMYQTFWNSYWGYYKFVYSLRLFWLKTNLVHLFYSQKPIIISELQGEYWEPGRPYETSLDDQLKLINLEQFKENIKQARKTGFEEVYFRGAEWWYWLKTKQEKPEFWEEAKKVIGG